jgi:hypothetical protein
MTHPVAPQQKAKSRRTASSQRSPLVYSRPASWCAPAVICSLTTEPLSYSHRRSSSARIWACRPARSRRSARAWTRAIVFVQNMALSSHSHATLACYKTLVRRGPVEGGCAQAPQVKSNPALVRHWERTGCVASSRSATPSHHGACTGRRRLRSRPTRRTRFCCSKRKQPPSVSAPGPSRTRAFALVRAATNYSSYAQRPDSDCRRLHDRPWHRTSACQAR